LNFVGKLIFEFGIISILEFSIKVLIYLTGFLLFFWNIKPFKIISIYFSYFVLSPIIIIITWLIDGLLGGLIASILLFPLQTDFVEYKKEQFNIYEKHQGFLDGCCTYLIKERELLLFEKNIKEIRIDGKIDFNKSSLSNENGILKLKYECEGYDYELEKTIKSDSTIVIRH